ncbi:MAG: hypothetical protein O3B65_04505 [Chloroflexi bacterium]|nr:hypothetical protein [Chloroflexota bacterium]
MEEPDKDLRSIGQPERSQPNAGKPEGEGLQALEHPEPLIVPREQQIENYKRLIEEEADRDNLHIAEVVKVSSARQILSFMSLSMNTYRKAREAPGFVAGGIRAKWWRKSFWTYLVWEDETHQKRFADSRANAAISAWIQQNAAPGSCYVTWVAKGEPDWAEAMNRLEHPTKYYRDPWMG